VREQRQAQDELLAWESVRAELTPDAGTATEPSARPT